MNKQAYFKMMGIDKTAADMQWSDVARDAWGKTKRLFSNLGKDINTAIEENKIKVNAANAHDKAQAKQDAQIGKGVQAASDNLTQQQEAAKDSARKVRLDTARKEAETSSKTKTQLMKQKLDQQRERNAEQKANAQLFGNRGWWMNGDTQGTPGSFPTQEQLQEDAENQPATQTAQPNDADQNDDSQYPFTPEQGEEAARYQLRNAYRNYAGSLNMKGKLGFWEYLWEKIKSWFGDKAAINALKTHDFVNNRQAEGLQALQEQLQYNVPMDRAPNIGFATERDKLAAQLAERLAVSPEATQNNMSYSDIKDAILDQLQRMDGVRYASQQAEVNPWIRAVLGRNSRK